MKKIKKPNPLFDSLEFLKLSTLQNLELEIINQSDYQYTLEFLSCYKGSKGTFNSYRREVERLLHWSWIVAKKSLPDLKRADIELYLTFCQNPPLNWIGTKKVPKFLGPAEERKPNANWHPFVTTISKVAHKQGQIAQREDFRLSHGAIKEIFAILSTFFNFLIQEEYVFQNPVALIRQKSQYIRKSQGNLKIRRLSDLQWNYIINNSKTLAKQDPQKYERILFIMSLLYSLYLRISELVASERWVPMMKHFYRDGDGNWWFKTLGKGNKEREVAVSDEMLKALQRWRKFLELPAFPSQGENFPLLPKVKGKGAISSTTYLREIIQECFDSSVYLLRQDGFQEEADSLLAATVHWLRHTGISDDVKRRPREHVRDDAGHTSSATTDKYIDVELRARHLSAKNKPIVEDEWE